MVGEFERLSAQLSGQADRLRAAKRITAEERAKLWQECANAYLRGITWKEIAAVIGWPVQQVMRDAKPYVDQTPEVAAERAKHNGTGTPETGFYLPSHLHAKPAQRWIPPEERRCKALAISHGRSGHVRCRGWALAGEDLCVKHLERRARGRPVELAPGASGGPEGDAKESERPPGAGAGVEPAEVGI